MTIFGDGSQTRAFTYIDDVVPYIARAPNIVKAKNQIFNIGADKPYTVLELAKKIAVAMKKEANIEYLPARNEVRHAFSDHSKAKEVFKISSLTSLDQGLKKMVEWACSVELREPKRIKNIEIRKNMPPSWNI